MQLVHIVFLFLAAVAMSTPPDDQNADILVERQVRYQTYILGRGNSFQTQVSDNSTEY